MSYRKIAHSHKKIHIYDDQIKKIICGIYIKIENNKQVRKKVYETEEDILKTYSHLKIKCKKCENVLKSRAGIEYERGGVYSKDWDYDKAEKFYHGKTKSKFCVGCRSTKDRNDFTRQSSSLDLRSQLCRECQKLERITGKKYYE